MRTTTMAERYVSRARFSASDRPVPSDFDVAAAMATRRANRSARATTPGLGARLIRSLADFFARLAGVRRSATLALTLMLATGVGRPDPSAEGAAS